jgi:hypothetical protein
MIYLMIMEVCGLIDCGVSGDRLQATGKKRKKNNVTCNVSPFHVTASFSTPIPLTLYPEPFLLGHR